MISFPVTELTPASGGGLSHKDFFSTGDGKVIGLHLVRCIHIEGDSNDVLDKVGKPRMDCDL